MGLLEHLAELRTRLLWIALAVLVGAIVSYNFSNQIFSIINQPITTAFTKAQLIGTGPAEAFILRIKVSIFSGLILTSPLIFWQIWLFITPGLYEIERRLAIPFVILTTFLFLLGAVFCHKIILPISYAFFQSEYDKISIIPQIRISEHLSMVISTVLAFGVAFELPIIAYLLGKAGLLTDQTLIAAGRYAIVAIFIIAGVLTPPDVFSQFLLAGPLLILYGISILVLRVTTKKAAQKV